MLSILWLIATVCQLPGQLSPQAADAGTPQSPAGQASPFSAEILETRLPAYMADLVKANELGLTMKLAEQTRTVAYDQLLRCKFPNADSKIVPLKTLVELGDGSLIHCQQVTAEGKTVTVLVSDSLKFTFQSSQVATCLLQPLDAALVKQWENLTEATGAGDVLVLQRTPEALDKIEGVITEIGETTIKFQFDGETIPVQRAKLAGWRFFSTPSTSRAKLLAVVRDIYGNNWMVQGLTAQFDKPDSVMELDLMVGAKVTLPTKSLTEIDFSYGSMRFLADIEPLERKVAPRLALAVKLPEADLLFGPRPMAAQSQRGATAGPGLQFMGSGSITYRVPTDFRRLQGTVALTPDGPQFVACKAQVFLEEKVIWEKTLEQPHELFPIDLEVKSGKRVRLVVESQTKQAIGDLVSWRQLRFVK